MILLLQPRTPPQPQAPHTHNPQVRVGAHGNGIQWQVGKITMIQRFPAHRSTATISATLKIHVLADLISGCETFPLTVVFSDGFCGVHKQINGLDSLIVAQSKFRSTTAQVARITEKVDQSFRLENSQITRTVLGHPIK